MISWSIRSWFLYIICADFKTKKSRKRFVISKQSSCNFTIKDLWFRSASKIILQSWFTILKLAKVSHCARWSDERYWSSIHRHRSKLMKISIGFISILCRFIRLDVIHGSIGLCIRILSLGASNFIITSHGPRKIQSRLVSKPMERRVGGVEIE